MLTSTASPFESPRDRAVFRRTSMFGGIDLMSARFVQQSFAPHAHDELMIGMIHAGVKAFRCGRSKEWATPGSLSVVNAGEMHTGECEQGQELVYSALYVPERALLRMSADPRGNGNRVTLPVVGDQDIWHYLALSHRLTMAGSDPLAAEEAMALGISALFQRYGSIRPKGPEAFCPKAVSRAMDYLHAFACEHIGLEDVSEASGVGMFHLIRLFKRHLGLTPHAYLTQLRIAKSRELLIQGVPLAQIALDLGFADQAHFTKRFKQLTGTTPAFYAKSML